MNISVIYVVKGELSLIGKAKNIINNISDVDYPKGKIEVIFLVINNKSKGERKVSGAPLVKAMFTDKDEGTAINYAINNAHGDIVILTSLENVFEETDFREVISGLNTPSIANYTSVYFKKKFFAFKKINACRFPNDLICARSYAYMTALSNGENIGGKADKIDRLEILRFMYMFGKMNFKNKLKAVWSFLTGVYV